MLYIKLRIQMDVIRLSAIACYLSLFHRTFRHNTTKIHGHTLTAYDHSLHQHGSYGVKYNPSLTNKQM